MRVISLVPKIGRPWYVAYETVATRSRLDCKSKPDCIPVSKIRIFGCKYVNFNQWSRQTNKCKYELHKLNPHIRNNEHRIQTKWNREVKSGQNIELIIINIILFFIFRRKLSFMANF